MAFMKEKIIYKSDKTLVYINQCHNKGKKTRLYVVRRDDQIGLGHLIGAIKWDGAWRQYVHYPEPNTKWSGSCQIAIAEFCIARTIEEYAKWKKLKK